MLAKTYDLKSAYQSGASIGKSHLKFAYFGIYNHGEAGGRDLQVSHSSLLVRLIVSFHS